MNRFVSCFLLSILLPLGASAQSRRQDNDASKLSHTYTIHGHVIDAESKESLIGANIQVSALGTGCSTNEYGYFSITLPEGENLLTTSYIGYASDTRSIRLVKDTLMTIGLNPSKSLDEVLVDSYRPETGALSSRSGAKTISVQQIMRMPALLGEADVIKTLHQEPGVQSSMSGQAGMSVRGGDADQNLFLLDGMMVYNVDHVMGFESAFMPDAVKHVEFFRGSFPARYGGRLSSVTDVRTKDGDLHNYHGTFSIGLLSSHVNLEGPIRKDKASFLFSARRTYADWLFNAFQGITDAEIDHLGLYFCDLNAKVNYRIGDRDRAYISFYRGRDVMDVADRNKSEYKESRSTDKTAQDLHWGNTLYQLRWNHIFSPGLFANFSVGYNRFRLSNLAESQNEEYYEGRLIDRQFSNLEYRSGIDDLSASIDLDHHPGISHHLRYGIQHIQHKFRPEHQSSRVKTFEAGSTNTDETFRSDDETTRAYETSVYAEDDMSLGSRWQMNAGIRAVLFTVQDKTYPAFEPRLSASRIIMPGLRAKGSYTMMHQYVHKITSSQIASPSDLWVPVTKSLKPMSAHQWTIGMTYTALTGWEFGVDAFWKEMHNVIDIIDGASFFGNSKGWEGKVTSGRGRSFGLEFSASKTVGRTTGMANYTLSKSDRWFPDGRINSGNKFPYRYDRRHAVHFVLNHQLTDHIDVNASWKYTSGAWITVAKQQTEYIEPGGNLIGGDYYSHRNNYQLSPTHQLDLSINFHRPKRRGEGIWNISLMNAYCHLNQDMVFLEDASVLKQITVIPILPSFSYTYRF
ncbi:MAG: TonB-dependent receptor [Bacteroidales bacterium]|nr:TonB-dependent receptor [Bacteroidales bacterium]